MGIILRKSGGWEAGGLNFLLLLQENIMKVFLQDTNTFRTAHRESSVLKGSGLRISEAYLVG